MTYYIYDLKKRGRVMLAPERINALIKEIGNNNEAALEELFTLTKINMLYIAKEFLVEGSYAEDVLSEAYLKIYKRSHTFQEKYNGFNWIYEIVKNTAIDFNRKYFRTKELSFEEAAYVNKEKKDNINLHHKLQVAIKVLDAEEYNIIYLRLWKNETLELIAEKMKYSLSMVYRKYNKALEKLRKELI